MPEDTEINKELKKLHDLNLQTLADEFAELLSKHVGGEFKVTPIKMEHTHYGYGNDSVVFEFSVRDMSWLLRISNRSDGIGLFANPNTENNEK